MDLGKSIFLNHMSSTLLRLKRSNFMKRKLSLFLCLIAVISMLLSSCDFLEKLKPDGEGDGGDNPPV